MNFLIADTFTSALARLPAQEQKAAKLSAMDLQLNPASPGLQMHRIDRSKDPNFWSARVDRDLRLILHKTAGSILLVYVDHHDSAYAWAERRRIETHPRTGAVQIVEVRERVEEAAPDLFAAPAAEGPAPAHALFAALSSEDLLAIGVPADWIDPIKAASEERFFELSGHLPAEAAEALLEYAATGRLAPPVKSLFAVEVETPAEPPPFRMLEPAAFEHPDAQRRFRRIETEAELRAALDAPWERWSVFLHPSQRALVERSFAGPARVAGSAGTGKTVVALHRAVRLARSDPDARVLLTTFDDPLAEALAPKLALLEAQVPGAGGRTVVRAWRRIADELYELAFGRRPRAASEEQVRRALAQAAEARGLTGVSPRFLFAEFTHVADAWQVGSLEAYGATPRLGRRTRLGARQRERLWPVFSDTRQALWQAGLQTWPTIFGALSEHLAGRARRPFTHVVVDEAQDLGPAELRFLKALAPEADDALFFAGDLGQRIFVQPFSWTSLGLDVRGRSFTLKVNYRTSEQIRAAADRLLPGIVRDADDREESRRGTISVFEGPAPLIVRAASVDEEALDVAAFIAEALASGMKPSEVAVFVRDRPRLDRARAVAAAVGLQPAEPGDARAGGSDVLRVGTMHLAKGLEFKAVAVMACDADALPLQARVESAVDASDLDEIYETERQLLYVAATRARDRLMISGVAPASEFLDDIEASRRV
jgi:hypothetical protein